MPPGTHVEIGPEAGFHIPEKVNLYLYDTDQWGWYGAGTTPSSAFRAEKNKFLFL